MWTFLTGKIVSFRIRESQLSYLSVGLSDGLALGPEDGVTVGDVEGK